ncbi:hypothetical protein DdX_02685 [Ditylenchus destructor]|uniref:Uncharacterized protein n=1 Tax=Ditylenchus destructor TaxID=166010 RepID=A0AAD4ND18_9BILA|nr:hypothetical protein DdX_02685 [Ditylenchus destructor]
MDERNAALIVKRACEEYGKSFPEFLNGTGHLKLVGYNMLDIAGQTKAKFFNLWLQSLNNACKSNPCNSEKFKQDLEKANAMTSQLGHKIH